MVAGVSVVIVLVMVVVVWLLAFLLTLPMLVLRRCCLRCLSWRGLHVLVVFAVVGGLVAFVVVSIVLLGCFCRVVCVGLLLLCWFVVVTVVVVAVLLAVVLPWLLVWCCYWWGW